jgi:hypothetical protein
MVRYDTIEVETALKARGVLLQKILVHFGRHFG